MLTISKFNVCPYCALTTSINNDEESACYNIIYYSVCYDGYGWIFGLIHTGTHQATLFLNTALRAQQNFLTEFGVDDLMEHRPVLLESDKSAIQARKIIGRMLAEE